MSESEAYATYLAAVADERAAIMRFLDADNAEPFVQAALDEASEMWNATRCDVNEARNAWYKAIGDQHGEILAQGGKLQGPTPKEIYERWQENQP